MRNVLLAVAFWSAVALSVSSLFTIAPWQSFDRGDDGRSTEDEKAAYLAAVRVVTVAPSGTQGGEDREVASVGTPIHARIGDLRRTSTPTPTLRPRPTPTSTPAPAPPQRGLSGEILDAVCSYAWPSCSWAVSVVLCESGGDPTVVNPAGPYYGLWQINYWFPDWDDPATNTAAAWGKYTNRGTAPWPNCP